MPINRRHFLKSSAQPPLSPPFTPKISSAAATEKNLSADPLRPQFHLLPAKNWMNDPNGPIFWRGNYHMFFQYNPNSAVWGDMHWNHAVSDDMIHWKHLPIALAPTPDGDDSDGCFTGSAVNDNGTATIIYTGVKSVSADRATLRDGHHNFRETQLLATSKDPNLLTWQKLSKPVIEPPPDKNLSGFRDPFLFKVPTAATSESNAALGIAASPAANLKKAAASSSTNPKISATGNISTRSPKANGPAANTPTPSAPAKCGSAPTFSRSIKNGFCFIPRQAASSGKSAISIPKSSSSTHKRAASSITAPTTRKKRRLDAKGNRILWGWITEKRPDPELLAAGWAGCMSPPAHSQNRRRQHARNGNRARGAISPQSNFRNAKQTIRARAHRTRPNKSKSKISPANSSG